MKGINHNKKVRLGGSSTRKPKVNLSNTYGIKGSSKKRTKPSDGAVTQPSPSTPNKNSRKSLLNKVRGS